MQHYTTVEQSKNLVKLGLKLESADMYYDLFNGDLLPQLVALKLTDKHWMQLYPELLMPCWSLGALIDLLPSSIRTGKGIQNQYEVRIRKYQGENKEYLYQIAYGNNRGLSEEWHDMINTAERENLINAVLDMVCWLLKNDYIKKGK